MEKPELVALWDKTKRNKIMVDPIKREKEMERQRIKQARAYQADPEKHKERSRQRVQNPKFRESILQKLKEYKRDKPEIIRALNIKHNPIRRASKLHRTPPWLTDDDKAQMVELYKLAKVLGAHVDHIIPLQGKNVSGLHVPNNLQLLTPSQNSSKRNKFEVLTE